MKQPVGPRRFRIVDLMLLVAATAIAFAIDRRGLRPGMGFSTFRVPWEPWVFYWMHRVTTFVAMWSFAVFVIDLIDQWRSRRRVRHAGIIACYAATAGLAVSSFVSTLFYFLHILEETQIITRILSHPAQMHLPPPFGEAPLEEVVGSVVLGAWAALVATSRWRIESSWIDRLGRILGAAWIGLLVLYLYGYSG